MKPVLYMARGYNFINDDVSCGYVGEVHTMVYWIDLLYGMKGFEYFDGWTDREVANYILKNAGYRLEVAK